MADNVAITAGSGTTIAADDVGAGVLHQRVKVTWGADGTGNDANNTTPLPVADQPSTATLANVSAATSSTTLQASNTARRGFVLHNDSASILYLKFGSTASATSYTYKVYPDQHLELPRTVYTGIITGIWVTATGSARVTELTA